MSRGVSYTILSARYANAENTCAVAQTVEAGPVAISFADTPSMWAAAQALSIAPYIPPAPTPPSNAIYVTHDLYRSALNPLTGPVSSEFAWAGNCLTSQSVVFPYPEIERLRVEKARWRLTWNPNTNTGSQTAVRLVACYSGPTILCEVASFYRSNATTPKNDAVDIAQKVNELVAQAIADQKELQFIHQTCGDAYVSPHIYSSALEIFYR